MPKFISRRWTGTTSRSSRTWLRSIRKRRLPRSSVGVFRLPPLRPPTKAFIEDEPPS
jgi:hypothetical protein